MVINHSFVKMSRLDIYVDLSSWVSTCLGYTEFGQVHLKSYCPFLATND